MAARWRAVRPSDVSASARAPASRSTSATRKCPLVLAACSGVSPRADRSSNATSGPRRCAAGAASSARQLSARPRAAAMCSGDSPASSRCITSAPCRSSSRKVLQSPLCAAQNRGVCPEGSMAKFKRPQRAKMAAQASRQPQPAAKCRTEGSAPMRGRLCREKSAVLASCTASRVVVAYASRKLSGRVAWSWWSHCSKWCSLAKSASPSPAPTSRSGRAGNGEGGNAGGGAEDEQPQGESRRSPWPKRRSNSSQSPLQPPRAVAAKAACSNASPPHIGAPPRARSPPRATAARTSAGNTRAPEACA
mmetsp:Transcript_12940/g.35166  ORF Transcript_12940/g.35166 Transcript_12940/m.35166 type:complete len:306 (+) Transcript_12940:840-1757(+)